MSKLVITFCLVLVAVVVQTSVLPVYLMSPFKPDLMLVIMVYGALHSEHSGGGIFSWFLGLLRDVFGGLFLGLNAFVFLGIYLVIKSVSDRLYAESSFLFVVAVGLATIASITANLLLMAMFSAAPGIYVSIISGLFPQLLVNAFVASLLPLLPGIERHQGIQ